MYVGTSEETSFGSGRRRFDVSVLVGRRDDALLVLYARQLIEQISKTSEKPLLLAISLSPEGRESSTFQAIVNVVLKLRCW